MSVTSNGATATDWYDPIQAAAVLGVSGPQLRALRNDGGLPQDGWRTITRGKHRMTEYNPAVIDKLAITNTGESIVAEPTTTDTEQYASSAAIERRKAEGAHVPLAEVWLAPREAEALAVVAKLGPFHDDSGRATGQVAALMPTGTYGNSTVSASLRALEEYALVRRQMNGKRTFEISVTSRGRKYVAANRGDMPHVRDPRAEPAPKAEPEPEAPPAEAITVRNVDNNGQVREHLLTARQAQDMLTGEPPAEEAAPDTRAEEPVATPTEPATASPAPAAAAAPPEGDQAPPGDDVAPAAGLAPLPVPGSPPVAPGAALGAADVAPGAIAGALLNQVVRVLSDGDRSALVAERDALAAQCASQVAHISQLRQRATDAETELRECRSALHAVESALTPLLLGRDVGADGWLDSRTRTELLTLITEVAKWA